jgi:hypothetical protein
VFLPLDGAAIGIFLKTDLKKKFLPSFDLDYVFSKRLILEV